MTLDVENAGPAPDGLLAYIGDMLCELAEMAAVGGEKTLAVSIRLAALQARRSDATGGAPRPVDPAG